MEWWIVLINLAGSALVGALVKLFVDNAAKKRWAEEEETAKLRSEKERRERQEDIQNIIQTELTPLHDKVNNITEKLEKNTSGTVVLLREWMKRIHDELMKRGYATDEDKGNWDWLYHKYIDLGGNDLVATVNRWHKTINELPVEKIKKVSKK